MHSTYKMIKKLTNIREKYIWVFVNLIASIRLFDIHIIGGNVSGYNATI